MITHFRNVIEPDGKQRTSKDEIAAIALQSDGKIVAAGTTDSPNGDSNFALVRYNVDGTIDTTFGNPTGAADQNPGRVITDFRPCTGPDGTVFRSTDRINGIAIQSDDKIVVAGVTHSPASGSSCETNDNFAVVRYNADGTLDPTWGVSSLDPSLVITHFGSFPDPVDNTIIFNSIDQAFDVAVQSDNKIVAIGFSQMPNGDLNFAAVRYNPDGLIDTTFSDSTRFPGTTVNTFDSCTFTDGTGASRVLHSLDEGRGIALQGNGQIIVVGFSEAPLDDCARSDRNFALIRYSVNGIPDTGFGPPNNRALTDLEITQAPVVKSTNDYGQDIIIQPDGRVIAIGYSNAPIANNNDNFALTRYFP